MPSKSIVFFSAKNWQRSGSCWIAAANCSKVNIQFSSSSSFVMLCTEDLCCQKKKTTVHVWDTYVTLYPGHSPLYEAMVHCITLQCMAFCKLCVYYRRTGFNCELQVFLEFANFRVAMYSINSPPLRAICADSIIKFAN